MNHVKGIIEGDFAGRIHEVRLSSCTFDTAADKINSWRADGRFTIFNAGTYDVLTINHILGLVQCRTLGAMVLLDITNVVTERQRQDVHELAASNAVSLMVTLDTNRALEESKSRRKHKGGGPKPTLDWRTRAWMLAMQSIPTPSYKNRINVVDYITRHGPECCGVCASGKCINEDNALMTLNLKPSLVVVNSESAKTISDIRQFQDEGLLPSTKLVIIRECENEYTDPILGGSITTTSIIKRIRL